MPSNVEREFKLRLPDEAAQRVLIERLGGMPSEPVRQTNHFLDTATGALRGSRLILRLREEREAFTITLKGPRAVRPGTLLSEAPEEELAVDARTARRILDLELDALAVLREGGRDAALIRQASELVRGRAPVSIGAFVNERLPVGPLAFPAGTSGPALLFEFDRTAFPGGRVDRELEVELPAGVDPAATERALRALFSGAGLPFERTASKAARFFRILDLSSSDRDGGD